MKNTLLVISACLTSLMFQTMAPAMELAEDEPKRLDIDFPGGMLGDLLALVDDANMVIAAGSEKIVVPPIKLRAVTVAEVMQILTLIGESHATTPFAIQQASGNTFFVRSREPASPQASGAQVDFLPIGRLLNEHSVEDIITTVSTAWEMLGLDGSPSTHLRFHEDTKLLIVTGDKLTLNLVRSALEALESESRSESEKKLQKELEDSSRTINHLEERLKLSEIMIEEARRSSEDKALRVTESLEIDRKRLLDENSQLRERIRELESRAK